MWRRPVPLLSLAAVGAAAAAAYYSWNGTSSREQAGSGERFASLTAALHREHIGEPVLLIDEESLRHNIKVIESTFSKHFHMRLVVKSLPCIDLLRLILEQCVREREDPIRLMVFRASFVPPLLKAFPDCDILFGKPMPVDALRHLSNEQLQQVTWLVDSRARLEQYCELAQKRGVVMKISIEVDVGLHRGGVETTDELVRMLQAISVDEGVRWAGLMGYDAHVRSAPGCGLDTPLSALSKVVQKFRAFASAARDMDVDWDWGSLIFNTGGSHTFSLYDDPGAASGCFAPINDLCIGTALLKPGMCEKAYLSGLRSALFIATPVLKRLDRPFLLPFLESFAPLISFVDSSTETSFFVFDGGWNGKPVFPAELSSSSIFASTNQECFTAPATTPLDVDDFVFIQPYQSECELLQHGSIVVYSEGNVVDRWRPLELA